MALARRLPVLQEFLSVKCEQNGCRELDRNQEIQRMSRDAKSGMGEWWAVERCKRVCKMDSMRPDSAVRRQVSKLRKIYVE